MLYTSVLDMLGARVGIQKKALYQLAEQMSFSLKEAAGFLSLSVPTYPDEDLLDYQAANALLKQQNCIRKALRYLEKANLKYGWIHPTKPSVGKNPSNCSTPPKA
jgi:hypothetical protein